MPKRKHQEPIVGLDRMPPLLHPLLKAAGVEAPADATIEFMAETVILLDPPELRADKVAQLKRGDELVMTVVIEIQTRKDNEKQGSWPIYVADVWRRTRKPVVLLVYCFDQKCATWAAAPIDMGLAGTITPVVVSPESIGAVVDPETFDGPIEDAVLSAMAYADRPEMERVLTAVTVILDRDEPKDAERYANFLIEILPKDARTMLKELMDMGGYTYTEGFEQYRTDGKAEGEADAVLTVLRTRGLDVPDAVAERVNGSRDLDQLRLWLTRAVTVSAAEDIFAED